LKNNIYFTVPLQAFTYAANSTLDIKIIFRCFSFYLQEETRRDGKSKNSLDSLGFQKDIFRDSKVAPILQRNGDELITIEKSRFTLPHVAIILGFHRTDTP
jgi:hypothetical protein